MNLGIFLSSGDSLSNMEKSGQRSRFIEFYLKTYSKSFSKIYLFSYANEKADDLPKNVFLVPNKYDIYRLVYGIVLPFINAKELRDCDVLRVFHLLGTPPAILSSVVFGKKYIFNFAYDYIKFAKIEKKNMAAFYLRFVGPFALLTSSKIIAANRSVVERLPKNKTVYIPNGVDINVFKPKKNAKRKGKKLRILSIGRLENQKNYLNLVKSLRGLNLSLTLIGQGSLKHDLEALAKKEGVELTIIDKVDNKDLPKIYSLYNIFVLPSLIEGSPKVLLEAMSCGLAVVASNVEGSKDIVNGKNGLLCTTELNSIRGKISRLQSNNGLIDKLGFAARRTVLDHYDLMKIIRDEIDLLKGLNE
jgi:glycosyltransferase involved in cell wall biosynthesis